MKTKINKDFLIIFIITLVASVMSISLYSIGQFWWDDFASYILQARAITEGRMAEFVAENGRAIAQSTYPVGPAAYPWGYPLLIAPIYALAGLSITALKLVNTLAFVAFLAVFYAYARQRFAWPLSAALVAVLAFNPTLLKATDLIQADFVFLLVTSAGLFLIDRQWRMGKSSVPQKILLGMLIFGSFFLRTNGILLLAPLALVDFLQQHSQPQPGYRLAALPYLIFLLLTAASLFIFPNGQGSYLNHYELFFSPARLFDNLLFYLGLPGWLFSELPLAGLFFALTGLPALWGLAQKPRAELPALVFSLLTLLLYISWPERQGLRFIYPILPFFLILAGRGWQDLIGRIKASPWLAHLPATFFTGLALLSLTVSFQRAGGKLFSREEINGPFDPVSAEMFAFVREETAADSTLIFFKPRLMKLLTNRYTILIEDCARINEGDYIIIHEKQERNGQIDPDEIKTCNPGVELQIIFKNQRFTIYQVNQP